MRWDWEYKDVLDYLDGKTVVGRLLGAAIGDPLGIVNEGPIVGLD